MFNSLLKFTQRINYKAILVITPLLIFLGFLTLLVLLALIFERTIYFLKWIKIKCRF